MKNRITNARLLGAHEVVATRLFAVARVSGAASVFWALGAGSYLFAGGVDRLSSPIYATISNSFGGYHVIGGILAAGGLIGLAGLVFRQRWLSVLSAILCAAWCGAVAVFLFLAAAHGWDNLVWWLALFAFIFYTLRFLLLVEVPDSPEEAIRLE